MHDFIYYVVSLLRHSAELALGAGIVCGAIIGVCYLSFRAATKGSRPFPWGKAALALLLAGYLAALIGVTLLRGAAGAASQVNLHLFRAWREAWNQYALQGWLNVLLNMALFVPLGVLLPLLARPFRRWYWTICAGFGGSLLIEGAQLATGRGLFDVDDLLCNTIGCMLGFCLCMAARKLLWKKERAPKQALCYLLGPALFGVVLAGTFGGYGWKEYGNLPQAPSFTANTRGVDWVLDCTLDDSRQTAPVYHMEPLDQGGCNTFAQEFADRAGVTWPDVSYYDSMAIFMNHSTGDFLTVHYHDRSYQYTLGHPELREKGQNIYELEGTQVPEQDLRHMLEQYEIQVPQDAVFQYEGDGVHTFTVRMARKEQTLTDGVLTCQCIGEGLLREVSSHLGSYTYYKEEPVIPQSEAYRRLCQGKFGGGEFFEAYGPQEVTVTGCTLEYRVDTKGFYQPVYIFDTVIGDEQFADLLVPARA